MVVGLGFGLALITGSAAFADSADRKHGNQAVKDRHHKHVQENKQHGRPTVNRDHTRDRRPVATRASIQRRAAMGTAHQRAAYAALQRHAARDTAAGRAVAHPADQHAAPAAAQRRAANGGAQRRVAPSTTARRTVTGTTVQRAAYNTTNARTVLGHRHSEANHRRSMTPRRHPDGRDGRQHMRFHYTDRPDAHDRHHDGHPRHHDVHGDRANAHGRHHDMRGGRHDAHGRHHDMDDRRHEVDTRHHSTHGRHHDAHGRHHEHPNAHHAHAAAHPAAHNGTHHAHQVGHQRHERQRPRRPEVMKFGDKSYQIRAMKQRLRELGFDSGVDDGRYGETTRYAVWAFQKVNGLRMTNRIDRDTLWALRHPRRVKPLVRPRATDRVEIDVRRQLLTVWRDGKPDLTTHISTGANRSYCDNGHCGFARTPAGDFRAGTRAPGWTTSPLGTMFNSIYFNGGIAMHGSSEVPKYPASHGCIRIPIHTSKIIYAMVNSGEPVYVRGAQSKYT